MSKGIAYKGKRIGGRPSVTVVGFPPEGVVELPLIHRELHSPDGFEWGYGGSGPADLALSILLDYFEEAPTQEELRIGKPLACALYQRFKWKFVAAFGDEWILMDEVIDQWLLEQEQAETIYAHAERWKPEEPYIGHDFGTPPADYRMMSSDPAYKVEKGDPPNE